MDNNVEGGETVLLAHDIEGESGATKTADIGSLEDAWNFESFLLSDKVLQGLKAAGFKKPSPVQQEAIPTGRCGIDMIIQAKSGTGKTCVFTVIALEMVEPRSPVTQVLVVAPTREIALQIQTVVKTLGAFIENLKCTCAIGGLVVNKEASGQYGQIVIGTPGRLCQLIKDKELSVDGIRLFILDEADKLMDEGYKENMNFIRTMLPEKKQVVAVSATFTEELHKELNGMMNSPMFVNPSNRDIQLLGVKQYAFCLWGMDASSLNSKILALHWLLSNICFAQCIIFVNFQDKAIKICEKLKQLNWPADYLSSKLNQNLRSGIIKHLKSFQCRVLVSTDLASRGIDAEHVNLVINFDAPVNPEVYFHRIGRAGRYGGQGAAVTIFAGAVEFHHFMGFVEDYCLSIRVLPAEISSEMISDNTFWDSLRPLLGREESFAQIASSSSFGFSEKIDKVAISIVCDDSTGGFPGRGARRPPQVQEGPDSDYNRMFEKRTAERLKIEDYTPTVCPVSRLASSRSNELPENGDRTKRYTHTQMMDILKNLIENNICTTKPKKVESVPKAKTERSTNGFPALNNRRPPQGQTQHQKPTSYTTMTTRSDPKQKDPYCTDVVVSDWRSNNVKTSGRFTAQQPEVLSAASVKDEESSECLSSGPRLEVGAGEPPAKSERSSAASQVAESVDSGAVLAETKWSEAALAYVKGDEASTKAALKSFIGGPKLDAAGDPFVSLYAGFGAKLYESVFEDLTKNLADQQEMSHLETDMGSMKIEDSTARREVSPQKSPLTDVYRSCQPPSRQQCSKGPKDTATKPMVSLGAQSENDERQAFRRILQLQGQLLEEYAKVLPPPTISGLEEQGEARYRPGTAVNPYAAFFDQFQAYVSLLMTKR